MEKLVNNTEYTTNEEKFRAWRAVVGIRAIDSDWLCLIIVSEFDECVLIEHGCEHDCINTLGGFECSCKPGYELHSDGKHCEGKLPSDRQFSNRVDNVHLKYFFYSLGKEHI